MTNRLSTDMAVHFGREICGDLQTASTREWLVTNGMGGYAAGTVSGLLTRRYQGLLIAALKPPLERTLLLAKLDETLVYGGRDYPLATNGWASGTLHPHGYKQIEHFQLEGSIPCWTYACADARLEKRIWMQSGANTTYIRYTLQRSSLPITLAMKALVNYRDHHGETQGDTWTMQIIPQLQGIRVEAFPGAIPFYIWADRGEVTAHHDWYKNFELSKERFRGLTDREDHLHAATLRVVLQPGETFTVIATTEVHPNLDGEQALLEQQADEQALLNHWQAMGSGPASDSPPWIQQLVRAADQFIVNRPLAEDPEGKTVIAGYPWFGDWGRDTMISLPGLTIAAGRPEWAGKIIRTFAQYLDQGMLPNVFPEVGEQPEYNTVDAILWYFEAIRAYYAATGDQTLIRQIFPALVEVIEWHQRGTRYNIHLEDDGLLYAGVPGAQLTWMDAKIGDWVVTPRMGKPIEINALWYNALQIMAQLAQVVGQPQEDYIRLATQTHRGFQRYWQQEKGYCADVLDGPEGDDDSLRPNQIFAVALPYGDLPGQPLLSAQQQQAVVDTCSQSLLTSYGLRSLAPDHPDYQGSYGGDSLQRDSVYHQGTTWGWLIGPFVQAHLRVYQDSDQAMSFLQPMADHLHNHGMGSLSEIFEGNAPFRPRGCIAQAWTVAEVLRVWQVLQMHDNHSSHSSLIR